MPSELTEFQKNVLEETILRTQANLDREPNYAENYDLKQEYQRKFFGALTPVVAQRFAATRPLAAVRKALHILKNKGLVEISSAHYQGSTIRWFPTSLIPK